MGSPQGSPWTGTLVGGGGGGVSVFYTPPPPPPPPSVLYTIVYVLDIESWHFAFIELNWYSLYSEPYHCDI